MEIQSPMSSAHWVRVGEDNKTERMEQQEALQLLNMHMQLHQMCHAQGSRVAHNNSLGLLVVIKAVFLTILLLGLVSLNGTGCSPCSGPGAAVTLSDGGSSRSELLCSLALISAAASWFTACCAARWRGTAACLSLLVSLCGGGGGGQVRPSQLPAGGGCEV